jgi:electron transfer flavoprotein alpha subunit
VILAVVEHDRGTLAPTALEAVAAASRVASARGDTVEALTIGSAADGLTAALAPLGVTAVHQAHHDLLADYGPECWGAVVAGAASALRPFAVIATGSDRGHEVLAHAAAALDLPLVANCIDVDGLAGAAADVGGLALTRVRWGGSLLEDTWVETDGPLLLTVAEHVFEPQPASTPGTVEPRPFVPELDPALARTIVADRVERVAGVTLSTARVVVGGGRGVGSADGFAPLEELAGLLGGVVGCSRAVTNNGWRSHTDQVGQTGTRIAPEIYVACGISGAIQHWVGAMASKHILAINTDPNANMVTKADYAVIGDLHEVVPAISAEIRRRRAAT